MNYTEAIKQLFESDITSYRIAVDNNMSPQFIDNYRTGRSRIENMTLGRAEKLYNYYNQLKEQDITPNSDNYL